MSSNRKKRNKREKRGSLNHQIHTRMQQLNCIGESRYIAKAEYRKSMGGEFQQNTTVGIHSHSTYNNYKQVAKFFVQWLKDNKSEVRNIEDIKREHIIEYIKYRETQGYSASTYSKDLAGLNKLFMSNLTNETKKITKAECEVANKSFDTMVNNRGVKAHHKKINMDNYKMEQLVGTSTGMRRESYTKVTPEAFNRDSKGLIVSVELKEKNGKHRTATVLKDQREELTKFINTLPIDKPIFKSVSNKFSTHRQRQIYAKSLYKQYIDDNGEHEKGYKGFDKQAVLTVSKNLGHNRDYVVKHYLCINN